MVQFVRWDDDDAISHYLQHLSRWYYRLQKIGRRYEFGSLLNGNVPIPNLMAIYQWSYVVKHGVLRATNRLQDDLG
jgi:hypothetical protein